MKVYLKKSEHDALIAALVKHEPALERVALRIARALKTDLCIRVETRTGVALFTMTAGAGGARKVKRAPKWAKGAPLP